MMLLASTSGLAGYPADMRDFLAAVTFARPDTLWLLLLLPAFGLLNLWAKRRRQAAMAKIGQPRAVAAQMVGTDARRWLRAAYPLAWVLLIVGTAGPRWGTSDETGVAVGRDVVLVLDLSQSMKGRDMAEPAAKTRWEAARNAALDLLTGMEKRGGHRVAVVVFAVRAKLLCPLTTDIEHAREIVKEIDGESPPPEIRPVAGAVVASGTRIGLGLLAAVDAHDKRFPGYQDIILVSDGDDPADDREWVKGTDKAREEKIPVHVVGVGDTETGAKLEFGKESVTTKLREEVLLQITTETRGRYVAARTNAPALGEFFRSYIEPLPSREVSDETIPLPKERYPWFLAPALVLLCVGWIRGK